MKYSIFFSALLLLLFTNSCKDEPPTKSEQPPEQLVYDTTSHNIAWFADALGDYGQELNDIWAADSVNFYAVGNINISSDPNRYWVPVIKWNGSGWVNLPNIGYGESQQLSGPATAIFGFGNNDIWVAGATRANGTIVLRDSGYAFSHFNGATWRTHSAPTPPWDRFGTRIRIYAMWGSDRNHLWAVGDSGLVYFWNGSVWTKQPVPQIIVNKGMTLGMVSGVSQNEVYASGYNAFGETVLLRYNGVNWEVVYLSHNFVQGQPYYLGNIHYGEWQMGNKREKRLWLFADNLYEWDRNQFPNQMNWRAIDGFRLQGFGGGISSTKGSNVWVTNRKRMAHWNGVSWKKFDDVAPQLPQNIIFSRIAVKGKMVVAVGYNFDSFSRPYYLIGRQE